MRSTTLPLRDDAAYFSLLTRKVFHAGFSQMLVDRRWAKFESAFYNFDPQRVAELSNSDVERLQRDPNLIRNKRKISSVVTNARHVCRIARTHGSFRAWLRALEVLPYECRADALMSVFEQMGAATAFWFLFEAGMAELHDCPDEIRLRTAR